MKKNKKILLSLTILISIIIIGLLWYISKNIGNKNIEKITETKTYNQLEFKNTNVMKEDDQTSFSFNVTNTSEEKFLGGYVRIDCINIENEKIGSILVYLPEIEGKQEEKVTTSTDLNLEGLYDYQIISSEIQE